MKYISFEISEDIAMGLSKVKKNIKIIGKYSAEKYWNLLGMGRQENNLSPLVHNKLASCVQSG